MDKPKVRINEMVIFDFLMKNNLSQKDLAEKLGVSQSYVSQMLCRTRRPSPRLRRAMLELLQPLTFDELFIVDEPQLPGGSTV